MRNRKPSAFTLIELLIVVAIIGILAAIAVPNFLNAQVRAKIARCQSDMRALATTVQTFQLERNMLLVDFWDDDVPEGVSRLTDDFGLQQGHNRRGGIGGIYVPLTTPVSYMSSIVLDPFAGIKNGDTSSGLVTPDTLPPISYLYIDNDPAIAGGDYGWVGHFIATAEGKKLGWPEPKPGDFYMFAYGPDGVRQGGKTGLPYSSSNGMMSSGDFLYASNRGFSDG